ncbi:MAG: transposase, partial [Erysipelotrichaceae bacterium]|nr:transposase [Erysipelotrichaceae bacterium]
MKTSIHTLKEYLSYSNSPIEDVNNLMKVIKRTTFGYHFFTNFKT